MNSPEWFQHLEDYDERLPYIRRFHFFPSVFSKLTTDVEGVTRLTASFCTAVEVAVIRVGVLGALTSSVLSPECSGRFVGLRGAFTESEMTVGALLLREGLFFFGVKTDMVDECNIRGFGFITVRKK
mmetsp:Transcript_24284/g.49704  ORF Transcript_24284/g.49704 Transcript_24284/m.49704 type:complete len:127 (+) Transcript_24284:972-1352(+)